MKRLADIGVLSVVPCIVQFPWCPAAQETPVPCRIPGLTFDRQPALCASSVSKPAFPGDESGQFGHSLRFVKKGAQLLLEQHILESLPALLQAELAVFIERKSAHPPAGDE